MGYLQEKISTSILCRIRRRRSFAPAPDQRACFSNLRAAKLREAKFGDFEGVAKLKQRSGIVADSPENWERLWRNNPALRNNVTKRPIGWVLEADGEIVGYLGNISLECLYGDRILMTVATHGFSVDPPYRAVAFSLAAAFYRQKAVDLYISSSAIEATGKMGLALKASAVPQPDYDTVLFWVLRPYCFARTLVSKMGILPIISSIAAALVFLGVAGDNLFRRRWPKHTSRQMTVTESSLTDVGTDIEALCTNKFREGKRIFADRTAEVLRWHFLIPGDQGSVRILRCTDNGDLKGYAIVRSDVDPRDGIRRSIIADLIATDDDPAIVQALWVAAYKCAKAVGSDILEVQGFPAKVRDASSDWRPHRRKYPACPYYYKAADPLLHEELKDPAAWYACPYDGDATLIRPSYSSTTAMNFVRKPVEASRDPRTVITEAL